LPENVLSDRELEIFMMIGNGISTKENRAKLNLSLTPSKRTDATSGRKMRFSDLNELVKAAVQWAFLKNR
jgi:FixJ family two-component response regulator